MENQPYYKCNYKKNGSSCERRKYMRNTTLREWIKNYNNGLYENKSDDETWYDPGWIDYHCKESSLTNRLKKMANVIKDIDDNFLLDNYYVCFKNNCPVSNPLYDDFRLIPLEERKKDECRIIVACGHPCGNKYMYRITTMGNGNKAEFKCKNKKEVLETLRYLAREFEETK